MAVQNVLRRWVEIFRAAARADVAAGHAHTVAVVDL